VTESVERHTCRRRKTWDVDVPRRWRVDSRPTGTAEQDYTMTCKQAPPNWNQFSVSQATSGAVLAPEWYDHVGKHQWRAVPPRSVLTVAVELDRQRCRTATRYSNPVDMTRMPELTHIECGQLVTHSVGWQCLIQLLTLNIFVRTLKHNYLFTGHYGPLVMTSVATPIRGIYVIVLYKPIFTYLLTSD